MFAAQLLRILQTLPPTQTYETCAFDAAELEAVMKASPKGMWDFENSENVAAQVESESATNKRNGFWDTPEVKCSMVVNEDETRDSKAPCALLSTNLELFEDVTDHYTDKKVVDLELPELMAFYNDNSLVKDICIDEGVPPCAEKMLVLTGQEDNSLSTELPSDETKDDDIQFVTKGSLDSDCHEVENGGFISDGSESSSEKDFDYDIGDNGQHLAIPETGHEADNSTDKIVDNLSEDQDEGNTLSSSQQGGIRSSLKSLLDALDRDDAEVEKKNVQVVSSQAIHQIHSSVLTDGESNKTNPENTLSYNSKVESATITFDFKSSKAAAISTGQSPNADDSLEKQPEGPKLDGDYFPSNSEIISSDARHSLGESSFSMAGPVSGLITYSGQIAYSGSVSHRSDSSTTSTRSFAFPVLPNEWNSSPIRMAKADRRHNRGWKHGLLCCRF